MESKYLTLNVVMEHKNFGKIGVMVHIKDQVALCKFSDSRVARLVYGSERKAGKDVKWIERVNGFSQKYLGKTREEIAELIKAELEKSGGKEFKVK